MNRHRRDFSQPSLELFDGQLSLLEIENAHVLFRRDDEHSTVGGVKERADGKSPHLNWEPLCFMHRELVYDNASRFAC